MVPGRQVRTPVELIRPPAPPLDDFESDADGDGVITIEELKTLISRVGGDMSEVMNLFSLAVPTAGT